MSGYSVQTKSYRVLGGQVSCGQGKEGSHILRGILYVIRLLL
jgi:hypothetical protein